MLSLLIPVRNKVKVAVADKDDLFESLNPIA